MPTYKQPGNVAKASPATDTHRQLPTPCGTASPPVDSELADKAFEDTIQDHRTW